MAGWLAIFQAPKRFIKDKNVHGESADRGVAQRELLLLLPPNEAEFEW